MYILNDQSNYLLTDRGSTKIDLEPISRHSTAVEGVLSNDKVLRGSLSLDRSLILLEMNRVKLMEGGMRVIWVVCLVTRHVTEQRASNRSETTLLLLLLLLLLPKKARSLLSKRLLPSFVL